MALLELSISLAVRIVNDTDDLALLECKQRAGAHDQQVVGGVSLARAGLSQRRSINLTSGDQFGGYFKAIDFGRLSVAGFSCNVVKP